MEHDKNSPSTAAQLAESRAQLRRLLEQDQAPAAAAALAGPGTFPRSKLMRLAMGKGGLGVLAVLAGVLLIVKPGTLLRLVRAVPTEVLLGILANSLPRSRSRDL